MPMTPTAKKLTKVPKAKSEAEEMLALVIRALKLPPPEREYVFHDTRKWRFDFAWPDRLIAVEVDGITGGAGGRHQRMDGFRKDCRKSNNAVLMKWALLRFTPDMVKSGEAADILEQVFKYK